MGKNDNDTSRDVEDRLRDAHAAGALGPDPKVEDKVKNMLRDHGEAKK